MNLTHPFCNIIMGEPGSGKSHLCKHIVIDLFNRGEIDYCYVITPQPSDWPFINPAYIFENIGKCIIKEKMITGEDGIKKFASIRFKKCLMRKIYVNQKQIWEEFKKKNKIQDSFDMHKKRKAPKAKCLLVIDDCNSFLADRCSYEIFQKYRHISTSVLIVTQRSTKTKSDTRSLINHVCFFNTIDGNELANIANMVKGDRNAKIGLEILREHLDGKPTHTFVHYERKTGKFTHEKAPALNIPNKIYFGNQRW